MKAIVYHHYGSPRVLQYDEVDKPAVGDDQVLIKVRAASVNPIDWHFMRGLPYLLRIATGLRAPANPRLGVDVAGQVEATGSNVTEFRPGDAVFGSCRGALAEYACASESALVLKPDTITFEQAAAAPLAALTALQALRDRGRIRPGLQVLINGAAGGVGTFAVQIARSFGAFATGVCSTRNVDMVRSIGADRVVDYTREDLTRRGERYDLVVDCVGNHSMSDWVRLINPRGRYVGVGGPAGRWMIGPLAHVFTAPLVSVLVRRRITTCLAKVSKEDLTTVRDLMLAGTVRSVIDKRYTLSEAPEAIGYLEEGHARGKVVVTVEPAMA